MSTISAQQSPVQAPISQGPTLALPTLSSNPAQQQMPVQADPVDQLELQQAPSTPTKLSATQQASSVAEPTAPACEHTELAPAEEPEKKPWYAGIVNFFKSLIEGVSAIFKAVAPIFQFVAPFLGPIGGLFSGMLGGASSQTNSPTVNVRPAPNTFAERGTNSVRANPPLGIATGPVIEAPRASITSG